jgi:hypothetical protein
LLSKNININIYGTIILPVNLYGCEIWSILWREEHWLTVLENSVQRKIFGPNWDEVTGEWRILHNEELHDLCSSPNIIRVMKSRRIGQTGHVARMGDTRGLYRVLVGRPQGKRPLGRPRRQWENNIKISFSESVGGGEWTGLIGLRLGTRNGRFLSS